MPTYEYRCDAGHAFDRVQKMSDKPVSKCPVCGRKASRVISGGQGVIFKGSGFYITDYGKDGKGPRKEPAGASAPAESKSESKTAEAKSESKPDSKSDAKPESKPASTPKPGKSDAP